MDRIYINNQNSIPLLSNKTEASKKIEQNLKFSPLTIKIYKSFVSLLLLIYWTINIIHFKTQILERITKYLTIWGVLFTTLYFWISLFFEEKEIIENHHFLHFLITLEIVIFFIYWFFIIPMNVFSNESEFEFYSNLFVHLVIQVLIFFDYFFSKAFFFNSRKNFWVYFSVFVFYFGVNFVFVKVFKDVPYKGFEWDCFWQLILIFVLFGVIFGVWYLVLWGQRFKFKIKEEFQSDKEIKKHFLIFK